MKKLLYVGLVGLMASCATNKLEYMDNIVFTVDTIGNQDGISSRKESKNLSDKFSEHGSKIYVTGESGRVFGSLEEGLEYSIPNLTNYEVNQILRKRLSNRPKHKMWDLE